MRAVRKTGSCGTRRVFRGIRCKKQASTVRKGHSVHENPLFLHGKRFLRNSVLKIGFYGTEGIFGTGKGLLWYAMRSGVPGACPPPPVVRNGYPCGAGGHKTTPERTTRAHHRATNQPPGRKTTTRAHHQGTRGASTMYSSRLQPSQCITAETLTCYSSKRLFSRA